MKLNSEYISKGRVVDFIEWFDKYQEIIFTNIYSKDIDQTGTEDNDVKTEIFEWKEDDGKIIISVIKMIDMKTFNPIYAQVSVITEKECTIKYTSNSLVIELLERYYKNSKLVFSKNKYDFDVIMRR